MIRLAQPTFEADEIAAAAAVLESGHLVQGPQVAAFEASLARWVGVRYAVACSSGTAALHLAMMALDLAPGDEVIVPTYTFPATANAVELSGGRVVVADVDPRTFNLDVSQVEALVTPRTRAIVPVHLFGLCADLAALAPIARRHGVAVVEDAACALGSSHPAVTGETVNAGTTTLMATWSFHPRKVITTAEGGMITTDDPAVADRLTTLRNHGATVAGGRMRFIRPGLNYRLTEMQGALGLGQMSRLDTFITCRRTLAAAYDHALEGLPGLSRPVTPPGFVHSFQSYVVLLDDGIDRDAVLERLRALGIEASIGTYALHEQPFYKERYGLDPAAFPGGSRASRGALALPLHPRLQGDAPARVAHALAEAMR